MKILILAGGRGTRLWPLSRTNRTKHLLPLLPGGQSLLTITVGRAKKIVEPKDIYLIVSNNFQLTEGQKQVADVPTENWLVEPQAKNTAAALAFATSRLAKRGFENETLVVLSADHIIKDDVALTDAIAKADAFLETEPDRLITFGATPTRAETCFGYIERSKPLTENVSAVKSFKEKPDRPTAEQYLADGNHLWNTGIFAWRVTALMQALAEHSPEHQPIFVADTDEKLMGAYETVPDVSIDYAVSEKSDRLAVIPVALEWSDIGNWQALKEELPAGVNGNTIIGDHFGINTKNSLVINQTQGLIGTIGLDNMAVIATPDATLVCPIDQAQEVKQLVEELRKYADTQKFC